jgi:hypothetical protein
MEVTLMVVRIPLSGKHGKGKVALVDEVDADLADLKWHCTAAGYATRKSGPKAFYLHRLIIDRVIGEQLHESEKVDHIDRNKLNNRRSNLRVVTHAQNLANANRRRDNEHGYRGVTYNKHTDRWFARLQVNQRTIHLGHFDTPEQAAKAYDAAARQYLPEHHGQLNFPDEVHDLKEISHPGMFVTNTSGYRGVSYHKKVGRWRACIVVNNQQRFLGHFSTPEEAARAYDIAAKEHFGPNAYLNFPNE